MAPPFSSSPAASYTAHYLRNCVSADRLNDTALGDDGPNQSGRRDVEGRVIDIDAVGCRLAAEAVRDFLAGALFDGNLFAAGDGEVEGRGWRGDVEGNVMRGGEDGHGIGADLVCGVAVGGDAIGADN